MSSSDDPLARMCYRKKAMPENHARQVAARAPGLRAYQCPLCSMWHVTNDLHQADGTTKTPGRLALVDEVSRMAGRVCLCCNPVHGRCLLQVGKARSR